MMHPMHGCQVFSIPFFFLFPFSYHFKGEGILQSANYKSVEPTGENQQWSIGTRVANLATDHSSFTTTWGTQNTSQ